MNTNTYMKDSKECWQGYFFYNSVQMNLLEGMTKADATNTIKILYLLFSYQIS